MKASRLLVRMMGAAAVASLLLVQVPSAGAAPARPRVRIPVSRSEVVTASSDVQTVAIADPKIADATLGSARTVVVTAKAAGVTTLVVYTQGGAYTVYDVESYVPNADQQVLLRVRIAEVTENGKRTLGFDWWAHGKMGSRGDLEGGLYTAKVTDPAVGLTVGPNTDGAAQYLSHGGNLLLQSTWQALEESGDLRTLASPALLARSGEKASFLDGGEIPVPVASSAVASGGVALAIQWKEFGVKVDFTPTVHEDSTISLAVAPEVSAIDYTNRLSLSGFVVPALLSRRASTNVSLRSGEHLVIGGLKQTDHTKTVKRVPVLGRVPLLGTFFSSTSVDSTQHELLLVVSPELVPAASTQMPELPTDRR